MLGEVSECGIFSNPETVRSIPSIRQMLEEGRRRHPERVLVTFEDGGQWNWAEALAQAEGGAALLEDKGVEEGDRIVLFLGNSPEFLKVWWGSSLLGAVIAPLNTAYKGQILNDLISRADPKLIVADDDRKRQLDDASYEAELLSLDDIRAAHGEYTGRYQYHFSHPHAIIFTSGTSGPSKGSISAYPHVFAAGAWIIEAGRLTEDDVFLVDLPLFHFSGLAPLLATMSVGGEVSIRSQPAMKSYWEISRNTGATFSVAAGTMIEFLMAQPVSNNDRNHYFRFILSAPLPKDIDAFRERFGLEGLISAYGSGEVNLVCNQRLDFPPRRGACGKVRRGYDVRIVDENDIPVPDRQIGEAIVRCDTPWTMASGYFRDPAATAEAWRNGWFHTGDLLSWDQDGYFFFHDRSKDSLRRRGENISSMEVERDVRAYPGISEVACVPFTSDVPGDDDVKVFIVCSAEAEVDFPDLLQFLASTMPQFMVPRYFEITDALPKTATHRVKKHESRAMGNSGRTWDAIAHGYRVTRNGLIIA